MWEWTTETRTGTRVEGNGSITPEYTFAVVRGGSFNGYGSDNAASDRNGYGTTGNTNFYIGFRVVLYIK